MNSLERQQMLDALGLVDWPPRADGPLARFDRTRSNPVAFATETQKSTTVDTGSAPAETLVPTPDTSDDAPWPNDADAERAAALADVAVEQDRRSLSSAAVSPVSDMDWDALEAWLAEQDYRGAQRPVFGVGARDADVLVVGEAPGANEDAQGVPFVGRAGQLLDRMLFAIGCARETNVYITNICKFRPPNNRDPKPDEVAADWPVLERQIELMDPKLVVAVGRVAAQTLLDSKESLGKMRGRLHPYPRRELDVLVTYHPAFLLRSPQQKSKAWDDLKRIATYIGEGGKRR